MKAIQLEGQQLSTTLNWKKQKHLLALRGSVSKTSIYPLKIERDE